MAVTISGSDNLILQVAKTTTDGRLSTTVQGLPTIITSGAQIFSLSFTPKFATSNILVSTSSIVINESGNFGDIAWLALWNGSTFVSANSGSAPYYAFASSLNFGHYSVESTFSAGTTATRTISVRGGIASGNGTTYINGNDAYDPLSGSSARIQMTVMEIAG